MKIFPLTIETHTLNRKNYYTGIFLNTLLLLSSLVLVLIRIYTLKSGNNNPAYIYQLAKYIIFFALLNIIYGLSFIIPSDFSVTKKVIYSILILAGIFPPLYLVFPIFQFTVFRKMITNWN